MIPILYDRNETAFENEGLGRLAETISCTVTEERNGVYEMEMQFPVTGKLFSEIQVGRIIACTHDDGGDVQPFDIYKKSEPIGGVVTFYGHHISYRLNEIVVSPFIANTCANALAAMKTNSIGTNPFSISTDKDVTAQYRNTTPNSFRAMLGGEENSILDVYGKGEYEFDKWSVILHTNRGIARSTSIRYGKNLVDYTNEMDAGDAYTAVVPYWYGEVSNGDSDPVPTLVTLPENIVTSGESVPSGREVAVPLDLSTYFEEKPTVAQLRTMATNMLADSDAWIPKQTITVDFVAMWQTDEYKEIAPLQSVKLCDTVSVVMSLYGQQFRAKVIKTVYNVLEDRYDSIDLGDKPDGLVSVITSGLGQQFTDLAQKVQAAQAKADYAASIAGDDSQYFWFKGTGTDTGAHITQIERDEFEADPTVGGGNLLARTNGVAVRDGLREIAQFEGNGITFNMEGYPEILKLHAFTDVEGNLTGSLALGDTGNPSVNGYQDSNGDGAIYVNAMDSISPDVDPDDPGAGHAWVSATKNDSDGARFVYTEKVSTAGSYQKTYLGLDSGMLLFGSSGPQAYEGQALTVDRNGNGVFAGNVTASGDVDRYVQVQRGTRSGRMIVGTNYFGLYDNNSAQWLLYSANNNHAYMPLSGGLVLQGHNSAVGSVLSSVAAAKSVASGTHTMITSITLPAGAWVVYCGVRFPSNASGRRQANLSVTSGSNSMDWGTPPVNGAATEFSFTKIISHTAAQTLYLNVYQNSGSTLSLQAGSAANYNCIYAVRIA